MPLRTLLGEKNDENTYADVCDELLASGVLSPVGDDILLEDPLLERGGTRDELAEFIEAEIQQTNQNDAAKTTNNRSAEERESNEGERNSAETHPSTSKRSNQSSYSGEHKKRDSDDDSQKSNSNPSTAGSTKGENTTTTTTTNYNNNNTSGNKAVPTNQLQRGVKKGYRRSHSFALLEDLGHQQPNYYTLGPILDDSAMRYVEMNPSYSKFDDLEYTPVNPAPMVGEFNNLGRNGYINEQQMRQMQQGGGSKVKQRQHEDVNTNISPTDNFGGPHHPRNHFEPPPQQQQQPLPPQAQAPQRGVVYHNQQQPPLVGVVQQEYTSVNRAGAAGPQPGNISWSHMPPQPGIPHYQYMQPLPPSQQHQYQMQQGRLPQQQQQQQQQQPGIPPSQAQMTRLDRLKRWKEKRKNRVFTKSIRYMSRKKCADNRPRIKGKFVKVSSLSSLTDIAENNDDKEKKKKEEGKDNESGSLETGDRKEEPREKAKSEETNDLIRDLREKAIEAGLGVGKPLSRLRRNNVHASEPNLASLADI